MSSPVRNQDHKRIVDLVMACSEQMRGKSLNNHTDTNNEMLTANSSVGIFGHDTTHYKRALRQLNEI